MKGMTATSLFVAVLLLLHSGGVVGAKKYKPLKRPLNKGLYCEIGFGQRGASFDERQSWFRMCHDTTYCWRGRTDTTQVRTACTSAHVHVVICYYHPPIPHTQTHITYTHAHPHSHSYAHTGGNHAENVRVSVAGTLRGVLCYGLRRLRGLALRYVT